MLPLTALFSLLLVSKRVSLGMAGTGDGISVEDGDTGVDEGVLFMGEITG